MRTALACLCLLAAACAPRYRGKESLRSQTVTEGGQTVRVQFWPEDAGAADQVVQALPGALERLRPWGALGAPVTITLYPSHEAFEAAIYREGYGWLRAWARYDTIDLQSPRSWSLLVGPSQKDVEELVTHELTHCVMYQLAGSEWSWPYKGIPLWFREGMASVAADQGHRRKDPEFIYRFYVSSSPLSGSGDGAGGEVAAPTAVRPNGDPVSDPEPLYQSDQEVVYASAHWAFQFLLDRYGMDRVKHLLDEMNRGKLFNAAFQSAIGIAPDEFESDFRKYIVWHGWKER
ncbi:hypothetical protein [Anaeromyxobacter paludicola]|uniref:Peptidase MA-like domain-containing protein n=1 Tax=Anaeromyxobacter paludicola TaxID=2918171 RepID=A0ABM7X5R2_9BACT|nr:hypothetical protein [Anaeromyxobacter paludicola]BDG07143.1 hypothetical protein AMPC_02560 [Anaeromyxobacter paludicola]